MQFGHCWQYRFRLPALAVDALRSLDVDFFLPICVHSKDVNDVEVAVHVAEAVLTAPMLPASDLEEEHHDRHVLSRDRRHQPAVEVRVPVLRDAPEVDVGRAVLLLPSAIHECLGLAAGVFVSHDVQTYRSYGTAPATVTDGYDDHRRLREGTAPLLHGMRRR